MFCQIASIIFEKRKKFYSFLAAEQRRAFYAKIADRLAAETAP